MESVAARKAQRGLRFVLDELWQVLKVWASGEGDLPGLLVAWWEVVSGQVAVGDD